MIEARCWGHVDPEVDYYHDGYTVTHQYTEAEVVRLIELMSMGTNEEKFCVRAMIDEDDGEVH